MNWKRRNRFARAVSWGTCAGIWANVARQCVAMLNGDYAGASRQWPVAAGLVAFCLVAFAGERFTRPKGWREEGQE